MHFLHGVNMLVLFEFHTPDLPKAALPDHVLTVEAVPIDLRVCAAPFLPSLKLGEVNLEAIFDILGGFLGNGGVAAIVLSFFLDGSFPTLLGVLVRASGDDNRSGAADTLLAT